MTLPKLRSMIGDSYPVYQYVVPLVMETTAGGSGGIQPDPSLETGRRYRWSPKEGQRYRWSPTDPSLETGRRYIWTKEMAAYKIPLIPRPETVFPYTWVKEKNLKKWRLRFLDLNETKTSLKQATIELREAMIRLCDLEVEKPTLKEIRGNPVRMQLKRRNKEAETIRRKVKREVEKANCNVSVRVFCPEEKKEEAKKNEIREEGETIELYPKEGLVTRHSDKFSDKGLENNVGKSVRHSDKAYLKERGSTEVTRSTLPLQLRVEKGEMEKNTGKRGGETMELYPKGGLMVINGTKLSDKNAERNVEKVRIQEKEVDQDRLEENVNQRKDKEEEIIGRRRKEDDKMRQTVKEHEEGMARFQQRIHELEQEERRLNKVKEKEGRIYFFPTWKPAQGVKNNAEEGEQYMTIGEDGRPYIAVRRKTEEEKEKIQEGVTHKVFKL